MIAVAQAPAQAAEPVAPGPAKPMRPKKPKPPHVRKAGDKGFRRALILAALLHMSLLVSFVAAPESLTQKRLGEPDADPDGVSVEIVDMADLKSRSNVPLEGTAPMPPAQQAQKPPKPAEPQEAQPPEQQPPEQQPEQKAEPQQKSPSKETSRDKPEVIEAPGTPPPSEAPPVERKPTPPTKQAMRQNPSAQQQPQQRVLDLRISESALNITPRSFQPSRPPGTTRSGENDQFFLGVIRALRRTFPELRTTGIVTVKIFLNTKGNISSVTVIRTSGDPVLDQNVVFAAKQASFPLPPDNSTDVDRTFLITYIYH